MGYLDNIIHTAVCARWFWQPVCKQLVARHTASSVATEIHLLYLGEESQTDFAKVSGSQRHNFFAGYPT